MKFSVDKIKRETINTLKYFSLGFIVDLIAYVIGFRGLDYSEYALSYFGAFIIIWSKGACLTWVLEEVVKIFEPEKKYDMLKEYKSILALLFLVFIISAAFFRIKLFGDGYSE